MPDHIVVAKIEEIPPGESKVVLYETEPILILNVAGSFFAVGNICPHADGPLNQGFVENGRITCPRHGWSFPLHPEDPPNDGLPRYRVIVEGDTISIEVPEVEVDKHWR